MRISLIAFTANGAKRIREITKKLQMHECVGYIHENVPRFKMERFSDLKELVKNIFYESEALVFVGACGIAVRAIAPYIENKAKDPAVIVLDERGRNVISLLSGHLGGANQLTNQIALAINANPVITTATDINNCFAVDTFAKKNNLILTDMKLAKKISAEVLKGNKIGFYSDYYYDSLPPDLSDDEGHSIGICISSDVMKKPFENTLNLVPKNIVLGIGCRRDSQNVNLVVDEFLQMQGISMNLVGYITSIDLKKEEKAILTLCRKNNINFVTYSKDELGAQRGAFTKSDFVNLITGVDNVCERSVVASGAKLVASKYANMGVTVAMGIKDVKIEF